MRSSPEQVERMFLRPMLATFAPPPQCRDVERALAAYRRVLCRFDPAVLERVWGHLARSRQRGRWPSLAQVMRRCADGQGLAVERRATEPLWQQRNRRAASYAEAFMQGDLGRQAAREHWAGRLQSYVQVTAWQQLNRGAATPDVPVPPERIAEWRLAWVTGIYGDAGSADEVLP